MKKRTWHILNIIGLLLCITVTFSWMIELEERDGRNPMLDFFDSDGNSLLSIAGNDIEAELAVISDDVEMTIASSDESFTPPDDGSFTDGMFNIKNFAPGDRELFVLSVKNVADKPTIVSINFSDLDDDLNAETSDGSLYNNLYIGLVAAEGFGVNDTPVFDDVSISDVYNGDTIEFLSNLTVPGSGEIRLRFYIRFHSDAGNEFQNRDFAIRKINIVSA